MLFNKKELVNKNIDKYKRDAIKIAKQIWLVPELAYQEKFASKAISNYLENHGFKIKKVKSMTTAFVATFGSGKTKVGILGEYDALPIIGHGCGHNLLGAGSMLAAVTLAKIIKERKLPLTISYFGCPAEESGAGKVEMVKLGLFNDLNYCLTWHPAAKNSITNDTWIGSQIILIEFNGKVGHSSVSKNKNVNEIMVDFICKLRELKIPNYSYIINSPNSTLSLIPETVSINLAIRSFDRKEIDLSIKKIASIIKTKDFVGIVRMTNKDFYPTTKHNLKLIDSVHSNFSIFKETPMFNDSEHKIAKQILQTIPVQDQIMNIKNMNIPLTWRNKILGDDVLFSKREMLIHFPTDVGAVAEVIPTIQFQTVCMPQGVGVHTKEAKEVVNTSIGHKGMIYAAKIMVGSILDWV